MTIRVLSLDFDGCLFHRRYLNSEEGVVKANLEFLNKLKDENQAFDKVIAIIGSNRQSYNVELANMFRGLSFPAVKEVSDYLETKLDTFLLADIYGNLENGTSYELGIKKDYHAKHADWLFDESKVSVLYAQMHKIALENPNEQIVFDFFDDRGNGNRTASDILEWLNEFYTENKTLIPANLTLNLHHYAGDDVTTLFSIKGTGIIDENYKQTVKDMSSIAFEKQPYEDGITQPMHIHAHVNATDLKNRKALSVVSDDKELSESMVESPLKKSDSVVTLPIVEKASDEKKLTHPTKQRPIFEGRRPPTNRRVKKDNDIVAKEPTFHHELFEQQLKLMEEKHGELLERKFEDDALVAKKLHEDLSGYYQQFQKNEIDKSTFAQQSDQAIKTARPHLEKHRGFKQILGNIALAFAGLFVFYGIAVAVNKYTTGHGLFFKTDSAKKIDSLEESINQMTQSNS
jgi:hypothetical protein